MRDYDSAELAAIQQRALEARYLVWITAKNRDTGAPVYQGLWNDARTVTMAVKDGRTGEIVEREFYGIPRGMSVSKITLTADITVRTVEITLPQLDAVVQALVRGADVRAAPVQIYRPLFDVATFSLLAPGKTRFLGYIDGAPIETPAAGGAGSTVLKCVSTTIEGTWTNPEVRSNDSQQKRSPGDGFYKDTARSRTIFWGQENGTVTGGRDVRSAAISLLQQGGF